jgi:hypothetical protein
MEMFPNLVGELVVKRTGMRLSLNPEYGKIIQDEVTLDLQFTRQNVDSYVAHSVFLITLPCSPPTAPAGRNLRVEPLSTLTSLISFLFSSFLFG